MTLLYLLALFINIFSTYICTRILIIKIMRNFSSLILCLFCVFFNYAQQQKDSTKIEDLKEVIITATRTIRQFSSLPLPAQIISKKEIEAINSVRLNDLLNEQTGLITVSDFGGGEGIQIQGLDSQYTLLLIDGAPIIGRSAGTLDLRRITVGNIKQIEIVKGASSSLYGSDALGGVINIITENAKYGFNGAINYRSETFNSHDISSSFSYRKNSFSINTFFNRNSSNGYDLIEGDDLNTIDPFTNYTLTSKMKYDFSEKTSLSISGRYFTQKQDYIASQILTGESTINEWNTQVKLKQKYNEKWSSDFEFYATRYKATEFLNNENNLLFSEADFNQFLIKPEIRAFYNASTKHSIIGGIGLNYETLERTDFSTNPKFSSPYIFIQYDVNPSENINFLVGARFDNHSEYTSQFSPKGAIRYKINNKISLKGSIGYGFKTPDFRQLYFDFTNSTVGYTVLGYNTVSTRIPELEAEGQLVSILVPVSEFEDNLNPENSVGINLGTVYKPLSELKFELNIFRNNIKDLIDTRVIATKTNGQNVFSYYNVNNVYTQGLEFNTSWKPTNYLKVSGGYQLLYAKDKDAEKAFRNGEVFARLTTNSPSFQLNKNDYFGLFNRSRHMANIKLFYTNIKWNINSNIRGTYRSKYGLFDSNSNGYLDNYDSFVKAYTTWDWALNKTIFKNYELGLGITNIFDFKDSQNISNNPGRLFYGNINIKF